MWKITYFAHGRLYERKLEELKEATIGRDIESDILIMDTLISKRHARMIPLEDNILIKDNKSTNGTYVDGQKLGEKWQRANQNSTISLGNPADERAYVLRLTKTE